LIDVVSDEFVTILSVDGTDTDQPFAGICVVDVTSVSIHGNVFRHFQTLVNDDSTESRNKKLISPILIKQTNRFFEKVKMFPKYLTFVMTLVIVLNMSHVTGNYGNPQAMGTISLVNKLWCCLPEKG
jgi:hypothetical protein